MGGKGPEVLSTFTPDFGGILAGLHRTKIHGTAHLSSSIQVAGVCLFSLSCPLNDRYLTAIACSKTPIREIPTSTHHRVLLLPYRRRREEPREIGQEDEEE